MAGTYTQYAQTINGCDSITTLILSVSPILKSSIDISICQGEVYEFNGRNLSNTGIYYDTLQTMDGCDSIITLSLTVAMPYNVFITKTICEGESYEFGNNTLTQAGLYIDSLKSINGCDSIVSLRLIITPSYKTDLSATICEGENYSFNGKTLNQTGTYYDTLQAASSCDSIIKLDLIVNPTYDEEVNADICQGESYMFGDKRLTTTGIYNETLQTINGCDSVVRLTLNVHPLYDTTVIDSICGGETYVFGNLELTESGIYTNTLQTENGCDSIVKLYLTFLPTYNDTIKAYIPVGSVYNRNGFYESDSGIYQHFDYTQFGCDSVTTLVLKIESNTIFVPNAITPVSEDKNSIFTVYPMDENIEIESLKIFFRWGELVYETKDIKQGWDGKYKGEYCQQGAYVYQILYYNKAKKDKKYMKTGTVMVVY